MRRKYTVDEIRRYPYPNLMAEFYESGYSICTLGKYMGIGDRCENDDPEVWARLRGDEKLTGAAAMSLAALFSVGLDYLLSGELEMRGGAPLAYLRHLKSNLKLEQDAEAEKFMQEIRRELKAKPYLFDLMRVAVTCSDEQIRELRNAAESIKLLSV